MLRRAEDAATSLPGIIGASGSVTACPVAYPAPIAETHLTTASSTIVLAIWERGGSNGRSGRVPYVALLGPAGALSRSASAASRSCSMSCSSRPQARSAPFASTCAPLYCWSWGSTGCSSSCSCWSSPGWAAADALSVSACSMSFKSGPAAPPSIHCSCMACSAASTAVRAA